MPRKRQPSLDYDVDGGRRAFMMNTEEYQNPWTTPEAAAELIRQQSAMCSFTESVDDDLPPAPELPPSLDIDFHYSKTSTNAENLSTTIGEMTKRFNDDVGNIDYDKSLGATQKYPLVVSGPGRVEAEQELHESLIDGINTSSSDSDIEVDNLFRVNSQKKPAVKKSSVNSMHNDLIRKCSTSALQRPRPTTPTSWSAIENYVEECSASTSDGVKVAQDSAPKMRVVIPSKDQPQHAMARRRKSSMSWSDFYETMSSQMPPQARSTSVSGRSTPVQQYYDDIIEQDPSYRDIAPPKPVIHRRTSTEWENFEVIKTTAANEPVARSINLNQQDLDDDADRQLETLDKKRSVDNYDQKQDETSVFPSPSSSKTFAKQDSQLAAGVHDQLPNGSNNNLSGAVTHSMQPVNGDFDVLNSGSVFNNRTNNLTEDEPPKATKYKTGASFAENPFHSATKILGDNNKEFNPSSSTDITENTHSTEQETFGKVMSYNPFTNAWNDDNGFEPASVPSNSMPDSQPAEAPLPLSDTTPMSTIQNAYHAKQSQQQNYEQQGSGSETNETSQFYPPVPDSVINNHMKSNDRYESSNDYNPILYDKDYSSYEKGYLSNAYNYKFDGNISNQQSSETTANETEQHLSTQGYEGYDNTAATYAPSYNYSDSFIDTPSETHKVETINSGYSHSSNITLPKPNPFISSGYQPAEIVKPQFMKPLLPEFNRPAPIDPFSWEAQEMQIATSSAEASQSHHSPPPPLPSVPHLLHNQPRDDQHMQQKSDQADEVKPKKPPPRPVPPTSILHAAPPERPKAPPSPKPPVKKVETEVDAWTQFKQLTEKAGEAVKVTEDKLKVLSETTVANEVKDESYIAKIGGTQTFIPEMAQKQIRAHQEELAMKKAEKKKNKKGHKNVAEVFSPMDEEKMNKAAEELAKKMAASRVDLEDWKPPSERDGKTTDTTEVIKTTTENKNLNDEIKAKSGAISSGRSNEEENCHVIKPIIDQATLNRWTAFDDQVTTHLPPSESDFFSNATSSKTDDAFGNTNVIDPFTASAMKDPFAPPEKDLIEQDYDPFEVKSPEAVFEAAKSKAAAESAATEAQQDLDFFSGIAERRESGVSSPTEEGGSPVSSRPTGFDDDFHLDMDDEVVQSPLYDEDDTEPLTDFPPKFNGDGWNLMIRFPIKKRLMGERFWKPCFVKLQECTLLLFDSKKEQKPFQELLLQASYSLSDTTLQAYDIYGKIHTVKLQYVVYKERVGIRPGQISRLVEGHITKYGLPLEHSAQCTVLLKFGSLNAAELTSFVTSVEDVLFRCPARREVSPVYKQDEVQIHCYDEYAAYVDKDGIVSDQKARVRIFCLAFLTGSPYIEIGLNDRRRQGREIVRRKDILPMYTERWIRFENIEFHNTVNKELFDKEQIINFQPPDGIFFEVMRFRIRPPRNREKPLTVKSMMKIAGSKIEIRIEAMAAAQIQKTKGGRVTKNQIPCEDIQIRFPIPEAWIYLFREERNWGVGSVHSKIRRPGKVKNLKDRLMGVVQNLDNSLIEVAIGEAKYEHVYRALVWRIPRLPERHHEAYKQHLLTCRFELSSFDLMPETFMQTCDVEFTMPLAVISNAVVRSVSVEQHEDSDRVEKFVRYVAKCSYKVEVDYVQCSTLDVDAIVDPTNVNPEASQEVVPELHKPAFNPDENKDNYAGYRIDLPDERGDVLKEADDSSSGDGEAESKTPMIQIDMKGYGY